MVGHDMKPRSLLVLVAEGLVVAVMQVGKVTVISWSENLLRRFKMPPLNQAEAQT